MMGPECMALDNHYIFRILLVELELVGEGELEREVLAVEVDLTLVEDFGETEGVAGVDTGTSSPQVTHFGKIHRVRDLTGDGCDHPLL